MYQTDFEPSIFSENLNSKFATLLGADELESGFIHNKVTCKNWRWLLGNVSIATGYVYCLLWNLHSVFSKIQLTTQILMVKKNIVFTFFFWFSDRKLVRTTSLQNFWTKIESFPSYGPYEVSAHSLPTVFFINIPNVTRVVCEYFQTCLAKLSEIDRCSR